MVLGLTGDRPANGQPRVRALSHLIAIRTAIVATVDRDRTGSRELEIRKFQRNGLAPAPGICKTRRTL
jgi:hypothetical protein